MNPKKAPIKIIANAAQLIEALAEVGALSPAAAAELIGIPRSSAYRLINGLAATDLIEPIGDGRVRLSSRWLQLSDAARAALVEWDAAPRLLQQLVDRTDQTAYLSVLTGDSATCIDWCRGRGVDVLALRPARSLPLYAGAAGRVLLAYAVDVDDYLSRAPFAPLTPSTLIDHEALRLDVEETRRRGYALARQDVSIGIDAIGVPIRRADGSIAGCLSLGGLSDEFDTHGDRFLAELEAAATELGQTLGTARAPRRKEAPPIPLRYSDPHDQ